MARNFNGTSAYLEGAAAVVTAPPFTMVCWFRPADVTGNYSLFSLGISGGTERYNLAPVGGVAGDPLRLSLIGTTSPNVDTTTGYTAGEWHHAAAVIASTTSRTVYLNGGGSATETTACTVATPNRTVIGARYNTTVGGFLAGDVAEAAIWNVALTAAEIASLAKGFSPRLIRPQSLAFYAPLISDVKDIRGGLALTDTGPTTVADHPRIIL